MDGNTRSSLEIEEQSARPAAIPDVPISSAESSLDSFIRFNTQRVVAVLCVLAAVRILVFSAAFPLTNTIDERFHLATIQMYAQGNLPGRDLPHADSQTTSNLLLYWSPEYGLTPQEMARDGISGPLWGLSAEERESALAGNYYRAKLEQWLRRPNYEAQSAPFYYVVAAAWYRMAAALGMRDWRLDYWPRFLNPIAYGLLVWLSYRFVCRAFPQRPFLQLAVPGLVAIFPQDVFYGMNRDVFSAPLTAAALVAMMLPIRVDSDTKPGRDRYLILGSFLCGLAFVSSVANCILYVPLAITLWFWLRQSGLPRSRKESRLHQSRKHRGRKTWVLGASLLAAGILPAMWVLRNYVVMGDLTGGKAKTGELGWTVKPLSDMLNNPLFSPHGLLYFATEFTRRFWRGEYVWHTVEMKSIFADRFYLFSSAILLLVFLIEFSRRRRQMPSPERLATAAAAFLVASSVLFIIAVSVPFDYHDCAYPSRAIPYILSGRIVSGAILPFVLLYAIGLERVTNVFRKWVPPVAVLACIMLFVTASEIRVRSVVFSSPYNYFALSGWRR